ncbi:alpha-galactosidase [Hyaloraphidium curvatum]|nr:alpha-galactosidase [Hyaloraphidium curvatum]
MFLVLARAERARAGALLVAATLAALVARSGAQLASDSGLFPADLTPVADAAPGPAADQAGAGAGPPAVVDFLPTTASDILPTTAAARRPVLGWNSWNAFRCNYSEKDILGIADVLVAKGYAAAGYTLLAIDDCWMAENRTRTGQLAPHPLRFPRGIKPVADYLHARGLKLGLYSSAGTKTCEGHPASLGHELADARMFALWGVDFLKYDNCYNEGRPAEPRYKAMADAIKASGRNMVLAMCAWGNYSEWTWAYKYAQMWRISPDIGRQWNRPCGPYQIPVTNIIDRMAPLARYAGPGRGFNDADMLQAGNPGLSLEEARSHFAMWAAFKSPLIIGTDIRNVSAAVERLMLNPELIAINQDPLGRQVKRIRTWGTGERKQELWAGPLAAAASGKKAAVAVFLNRASTGVSAAGIWPFALAGEPLGGMDDPSVRKARWYLRDALNRRDLHGGLARGGWQRVELGRVPAHGAAVVRMTQA